MPVHSEDEDIVLEGSALHNHLVTCGYRENIETVKGGKDDRTDGDIQGDAHDKNAKFFVKNLSWFNVQQFFSCILIGSFNRHPEIEVAKNILESDLLVVEDEEFFRRFILADESHGLQLEESSSLLFDSLMLSCSLAVMIGDIFLSEKITMVVSTLLGVAASVFGIRIVTHLMQQKQSIKILNMLRKMVMSMNQFKKVMMKSLNLIRGMEMIPTGHILGAHFTLSPAVCRTREMMPLRQAMYSSTVKTILALRQGTLSLVSVSPPLAYYMDHDDQYLATVDLVHLGVQNTGLVEASSLTVRKLRDLVDLYLLQQSEYVRSLCLTACRKSSEESVWSEVSVVANQHAEEMTSRMQAAAVRLEQVLEYTSMCSELGAEDKRAVSLSSGQRLPLPSVLTNLLHNCMMKVRHLEDSHDYQVQQKDDNPNHWLKVLQDIQTQLKTCQHYLDESTEHIKSRISLDQEKEVGKIGDSVSTSFGKLSDTQDKLLSSKVISEEDAVVHIDEVFEAYVDSVTTGVGSIAPDVMNEVENIKTFEEKNNSRKLMVELKSVLIGKKNEWKAREAIALAHLEDEAVRNSDRGGYDCDLPVLLLDGVRHQHCPDGVSLSDSSCSYYDSGVELLGRDKQFKRPLRAAAVKQQAGRVRGRESDREVNTDSELTFSLAEAVATRCSQLRQQEGGGEEYFGEYDSDSNS